MPAARPGRCPCCDSWHRRPGRAVRRRPHGGARRPERHRQRAYSGRPVARRRPLPGSRRRDQRGGGVPAASGCAGGFQGGTSSASTAAVTSGLSRVRRLTGQRPVLRRSRLAGEWRRASAIRIDVKRPQGCETVAGDLHGEVDDDANVVRSPSSAPSTPDWPSSRPSGHGDQAGRRSGAVLLERRRRHPLRHPQLPRRDRPADRRDQHWARARWR